MLLSRKLLVAIAAALVFSLLVPSAAHPQYQRLAGSPSVAGSAQLGQNPAFCPAEEDEVAPLSHRNLLAGDFCDSLPISIRASGFCGVRASDNVCVKEDSRVQARLIAMGKRGEIIAAVRAQVLEILQSRNACSAWYQEVDADPAGTFRSLEFFLDENGPPYIYSMKDPVGGLRLKQPYVASAYENAGRNATIQVNAKGAFFNRATEVLELYPGRGPSLRRGLHILSVASYSGSSSAAQVTTMLHELGHIVGRIPEDSDSWDGLSARNTAAVLRFCRPEIDTVARGGHR